MGIDGNGVCMTSGARKGEITMQQCGNFAPTLFCLPLGCPRALFCSPQIRLQYQNLDHKNCRQHKVGLLSLCCLSKLQKLLMLFIFAVVFLGRNIPVFKRIAPEVFFSIFSLLEDAECAN
jgi:hypothetical protein